MRLRFTIRDLLWLTLVVALPGCSRVTQEVKTPDQLTLYSVNTQEDFPDVGEGRFHNFPVLGKVEITDAEQRHEIMAAVMDGISRGGGVPSVSGPDMPSEQWSPARRSTMSFASTATRSESGVMT